MRNLQSAAEARHVLLDLARTNPAVDRAFSMQREHALTNEMTYLLLSVYLADELDELRRAAAACPPPPQPFVMPDIWAKSNRGVGLAAPVTMPEPAGLRIREVSPPAGYGRVEAAPGEMPARYIDGRPTIETPVMASAEPFYYPPHPPAQPRLGEAAPRQLPRMVKLAGQPSQLLVVDVCECPSVARHGAEGGICGACGSAIPGKLEGRMGGKFTVKNGGLER